MSNSLIPLGSPAYNEDRIRSLADASNRRKAFTRTLANQTSTPPSPPSRELVVAGPRRSMPYGTPQGTVMAGQRPLSGAAKAFSYDALMSAKPKPATASSIAMSSGTKAPAPAGRSGGTLGRIGGVLAGGYEAYQAGKTALDPNATATDAAQQARSGVFRLGGGALGAGAGSAMGPIGTAAGGAGGYYAGDFLARKMNQAEREAPMTPDESKRFINMPLAARRAYGAGVDYPEWNSAGQAAKISNAAVSTAPVVAPTPAPTTEEKSPITRVGNRVNTPGGYIESNDAAGLSRVEAGLRGVQPKDGQSYVSNNFMTVPAYQTPEWLIKARELKAQREQNRAMSGPRIPEMPQAPTLQKFDARTQSFSDLGNAKRQNRLAREAYALQMGTYNNAVDNAGATERQGMQNDAMMQRQQLEQKGAMDRMQAELAVQAPYRQAMSDYYKANADESRANAGWRQAIASGRLSTRGQGSTGDTNKLYSVELGDDANGRTLRALGDPSTGALYRYDMESGKLSPLQMPQPLTPMSLDEFAPAARNILKANESTRGLDLNDGFMAELYRKVFGD